MAWRRVHELALPEVTLEVGLRWLDLLGVLAFSLSGALLAVRKRFDLFGVLVLGCVTAVGGGAIRDTLTGQAPPLFLRDETYLWVALLGAVWRSLSASGWPASSGPSACSTRWAWPSSRRRGRWER